MMVFKIVSDQQTQLSVTKKFQKQNQSQQQSDPKRNK